MYHHQERKISSRLICFLPYLYKKRSKLTITVIIIIITVLISISAFSNEKIMNDLIFYPPAVANNNQYYRFITCGFIHADYGHLIFNMLSLFLFGQIVEEGFKYIFGGAGTILYLAMYIFALIVSLLPTYFKNRNNSYYRSLGASGAVSAVIFAGIMLEPNNKIGLLIFPIMIPGFVFGPIYLLISAWLDRKGGDNINHSAHIWGALFGVLFLIVAGQATGEYNAVEEFVTKVRYYFNS
jgi:membrane associated rhomboid family serine protease